MTGRARARGSGGDGHSPLPMKPIGLGLAGARYGARMHLGNYAALPPGLLEVRGVCSRTRETGEALAREAKIPFVTQDFDALLARPAIDVIDVCLPPALHHEFAIRAAAAASMPGGGRSL